MAVAAAPPTRAANNTNGVAAKVTSTRIVISTVGWSPGDGL
jgi:hypothetical protein